MQALFELGINETDINHMIEINEDLVNFNEREIKYKIILLKSIECDNNQIINIITTNSQYFSRIGYDILNLFGYLKNLNIKSLNNLFELNPFILNLHSFEIKKYIDNKINNNYKLEDIVLELEENPLLFNEM